MITDQIQNASVYSRLRPGIRRALNYIIQTDLEKIEPGVYEAGTPDLRAIVSEYETHPEHAEKWEAHRLYIDVQFIIAGQEYMGYTFLPPDGIVKPYEEQNDIIFYRATGNLFLLPENCFAIFYPGELHQPGISAGAPVKIKKVVVKVPFNEYE